MKSFTFAIVSFCVLFAGATKADVTTFTETFDNDNSGWLTAINTAPTYNPVGGPDETGAISFDASFLNLGMGTVFRDSFSMGNASDGAFAGDWVSSEVETLSFSFRHNVPAPVELFVRIAPPGNFPGAIAVPFGPPVLPNQWTDVTLSVVEGSPNLISFSGGAYGDIFPNVGNIQFGVNTPDGFEMNPTDFTFELDNVGITTSAIPEPTSALSLFGLTAVTLIRRRSR
jgi:hypothetical protein